jgi:hypothetical protein
MPAGSYRVVSTQGGELTAETPFGKRYHPGVAERERAGVVTVAAGQHLEGIDILVPELARTIELRGRFVFLDGVGAPGQLVDFLGQDGRSRLEALTDGEGNFVMRLLAGQTGTLRGRLWIFPDLQDACPQFCQQPGGEIVGYYWLGIEVVFPARSCEAWLRRVSRPGLR